MAKTPETPFNGVVVDREVLPCTKGGAAKLSLVIMAEESPPGSRVVVLYTSIVHETEQPSLHLRVGHKVRVTGVKEDRGFIFATGLSYHMTQFANAYLAAQKEAKQGDETTAPTAKAQGNGVTEITG